MCENLTAFAVIDRRACVNTLSAQAGIQPVSPQDPQLAGLPNVPLPPNWLDPNGLAQA